MQGTLTRKGCRHSKGPGESRSRRPEQRWEWGPGPSRHEDRGRSTLWGGREAAQEAAEHQQSRAGRGTRGQRAGRQPGVAGRRPASREGQGQRVTAKGRGVALGGDKRLVLAMTLNMREPLDHPPYRGDPHDLCVPPVRRGPRTWCWDPRAVPGRGLVSPEIRS